MGSFDACNKSAVAYGYEIDLQVSLPAAGCLLPVAVRRCERRYRSYTLGPLLLSSMPHLFLAAYYP